MELIHAPGEVIAQRYRIQEPLGQGGSGITYQAEEIESSQPVALKTLSLEHMTEWKMIELFEREAHVLAQLNHPSIPRYLEYFHIDTASNRCFYIAQQLAPGKSLAELVQSGWRATEAEVRQIAIQILEILLYLHSLEPPVIHRDIKPQNIIRREDGQVFLVDFGAVQDTYHSTFARSSTVVGTFGYMAPEQFRGQAVPTTDLYGLGATLLFLLTHRSPADLPMDRLKINFRSRLEISQEFADWLEQMLEPDVEDRFSSATEALAVLRGKQILTAKPNSSVPWKALVGVGIAAVAAVGALNTFKYPILNSLGLAPSVHKRVEILDEAIQKGDIDALKNYLGQGGDINVRDDQGFTWLHWAAIECKTEVAQLLIAEGANVNAKDNEGNTPLHQMLASSHPKTFIQKVNGQQLWRSDKEFAELLITKGADVNAKNNRGNTPLSLAIKRTRIQVVKLLIDKGAQMSDEQVINAKSFKDITLLHLAVANDWKDVVQVLLNHGAKVNVKTRHGFDGYTPLEMGLREEIGSYLYAEIPSPFKKDKQNLVKLLLTKGAFNKNDINTLDLYGSTPLHRAVEMGWKDVVELLIAKGADVNAKDSQGYTPLYYAGGRTDIIEVLKRHGGTN